MQADEVMTLLSKQFPRMKDDDIITMLAMSVSSGSCSIENATRTLREMEAEHALCGSPTLDRKAPTTSSRFAPPPGSLQRGTEKPARRSGRRKAAGPLPDGDGGELQQSASTSAGGMLSPPVSQERADWATAPKNHARSSPKMSRAQEDDWRTAPAKSAQPTDTDSSRRNIEGHRTDDIEHWLDNLSEVYNPPQEPATRTSASASPPAVTSKESEKSAFQADHGGIQAIVYFTSITASIQVRDHCRALPRLLDLCQIPFHQMDVSENKFIRKQLIEACGGKDLGLPLLFVGDQFVGTYEMAQDLVDNRKLISTMEGLGFVHPVPPEKRPRPVYN